MMKKYIHRDFSVSAIRFFALSLLVECFVSLIELDRMCGGVGALFAVAEAHHFVLLFFLKGAFFSSLFFLFYLKKKASSLESPFISRPTNVCRHNVQLRGTRKWIGGREMEEKTTKVPFYFSYVQTESGLFFLLLLCN